MSSGASSRKTLWPVVTFMSQNDLLVTPILITDMVVIDRRRGGASRRRFGCGGRMVPFPRAVATESPAWRRTAAGSTQVRRTWWRLSSGDSEARPLTGYGDRSRQKSIPGVHVSFVGDDHGRAAEHGSELLCLSDARS
jgi:hypothetical protein